MRGLHHKSKRHYIAHEWRVNPCTSSLNVALKGEAVPRGVVVHQLQEVVALHVLPLGHRLREYIHLFKDCSNGRSIDFENEVKLQSDLLLELVEVLEKC